jgi:uncharacterized protein YcfL
MMRKVFPWVLLASITLCETVLCQDAQSPKTKDTLFIGNVKVAPSVLKKAKDDKQTDNLERARDIMISQLPVASSNGRVFQLVDRDRMNEIMQEKDLTQILSSDPKSVEILKLLGAKYALFVEINAFEFRADKTILKGQVDHRYISLISATAKITDVDTGKILPDMPAVVKTLERKVLDGEVADAAINREQMIVELSKQVSTELVHEVQAILYPAKVLVARKNEVMINRGEEFFPLDTKIEIYASNEVKDPNTGEKFLDEVKVGEGVIVRTDKQKSFAKLIGEDTGINTDNCIVRAVKTKNDPKAEPTPRIAVIKEIEDNTGDLKKVLFSHEKLKKMIAAEKVDKAIANGFLKVSVKLKSNEKVDAIAKFKWFKKDNIEILPPSAPKPIYLEGNQSITVSAVAPSDEAVSFELILEPSEK